MNDLKAKAKRLPKILKKRRTITLISTFFLFAAVAALVARADVRDTNQIGRLSYRLDRHYGQVVTSGLPDAQIASGTVKGLQLYNDSGCSQVIKHCLLPNDWVVEWPDSNLVCYPLTSYSSGDDEGRSTTAHYVQWENKKYIISGKGKFSGTGWNTSKWYRKLPTKISYKSKAVVDGLCSSNGDTLYVANNSGEFNVVQDDNYFLYGYYALVSKNRAIMYAYPTDFCKYNMGNLKDAVYSWYRWSQLWSAENMKQGKNTVYYAGMDASGNFTTGKRAINWDTKAPLFKMTEKVWGTIRYNYGLQLFASAYGHNGWLNHSTYVRDGYFNIGVYDDTSETKDVSGAKANSISFSMDNTKSFGSAQTTTEIQSDPDTEYYAGGIDDVMDMAGEGKHTLYFKASDNAGNESIGSQAIKIDTVFPTISAKPVSGQFNSTKEGIAVALSFSDKGSGIDEQSAKYQWVQPGNEPSGSGWKQYDGGTVTQTQKGTWQLYVEVSDIAGNTTQKTFGAYYCGSLTGEIVPPNRYYKTDIDVITSVKIHSNDSGDITPSNNASVSFMVKDENGNVVTNQVKALVVPNNNTQLIWFRWHTPSGETSITITATINSSLADAQHNPFSINKYVSYLLGGAFTDMGGNLTMPSWFNRNTSVPTADMPSASWQEWTYYGGFTLNTYTAAVSSKVTLKADPDDPTYTQDKSGNVTMKSGYGIMEIPTTTVTSTHPDKSAVTDAQIVYGLFPEWNYQSDHIRIFNQTSISSTLGKIMQTFNLPVNPKFTNGTFTYSEMKRVKEQHVHFTPLAFPDGKYTVQVTSTDIWTPAGSLDGAATGYVTIKGNLYDDWTVRATTESALKSPH